MIPIRNLYAMLAFYWRDAELLDGGALGAFDFEHHLDVAARLLDFVLTRLFRRGLDLGYQVIEDAGPQPRGALDLARTTRELLTVRAQLAFKVDDLLADTPANRVIKASVSLLMRRQEVGGDVRQRLRRRYARLAGVSLISPQDALRITPRVPRHERAYEEALWLARLTLSTLLPDEGIAGRGRTRALRIEDRLPLLFQGFIRGAATHFLAGRASVSAPKLSWSVERATARALSLIPKMSTDVVVEWAAGGRSLLECKFYEAPLTTPAYGTTSDGERFRIGHLYQIAGYVNVMSRDGERPSATIVYASPGGTLDETLLFEGIDLRVVWVDLQAEWSALSAQVKSIVSWRGLPASTSPVSPPTARLP